MKKRKKLVLLGMLLVLVMVFICGCAESGKPSVEKPNAGNDVVEYVAGQETEKVTEPTAEETKAPATEPTKQETTEPETTQAPKSEGTLMEMTSTIQYRTNVFLSDFSEQWFHEGHKGSGKFETKSADIMEIAEYCWIFAKINLNKAETVVVDDMPYYGVGMDTIDSVAMRFFNVHVYESDIGQKFPGSGCDALLIDGKLCCIAADGETYNHMSVVDTLTDLGNGRVRAEFCIYAINDIGGAGNLVLSGGLIQDRNVYYYGIAEAEGHPSFSRHASGVAIMDYSLSADGDITYKLVSYEVMP